MAALPPSVGGHFGPELRRFVLLQHHQGQVTVELLLPGFLAMLANKVKGTLKREGQLLLEKK